MFQLGHLQLLEMASERMRSTTDRLLEAATDLKYEAHCEGPLKGSTIGIRVNQKGVHINWCCSSVSNTLKP